MVTNNFFDEGGKYIAKFHLYEVNYKRLENINESKLAELKLLVEEKKSRLGTRKNTNPLDLYFIVLRYITNPLVYKELHSYDEKVIFFILYLDPTLEAYKIYLESNLPFYTLTHDMSDINNKLEYEEILSTLKEKIRKKIGFFDEKILKFEDDYFKKFIRPFNLVTNYNGNIELFLNLVLEKGLQLDIKEYDFEKLLTIIEEYKLKYGKVNYKTIIYQALNQHNLLKLDNIFEELMFIVLNIDPNLEMYRIYEEESNWNIVEKRIKEQFGFFNKDLVLFEKKISKLLYPDVKFEF